MKRTAIVLLLLAFTGCGFFREHGQWADDSKNWRRAFGVDLPAGLTLRHSYFEQSAHPLFREFTYYFEMEDTSAVRQRLEFGTVLKKVAPESAAHVFVPRDTPAPWFPRNLGPEHEVWSPQDGSSYLAIVDTKRNTIFLTDSK